MFGLQECKPQLLQPPHHRREQLALEALQEPRTLRRPDSYT